MAPPSTQVPAASTKSHRSSSPRPESKASKRQPQAPAPPPSIHYTLLIRLPFPRGDFEDPPLVEWDASKDRKLWKIISKNPKSGDIDWAQRADEFGVTQPFLLQQAAWLYERHFQHVKAQMSRLRSSNAPTPNTGAAAGQMPVMGGLPMKRLGSGGCEIESDERANARLINPASRAPSSLSIRARDSPLPRVDTSIPASPRPGTLSRTPSTNTVTQSRHFLPPSPRRDVPRSFRTSQPPPPRKLDTAPLLTTTETNASSPASDSSSSTSSDSDNGPIRRSQMFRRPPAPKQKKRNLSNVDDENEESDDSLPFAKPATGQRDDPSATLRDTPPAEASSRARSGTAGGTRPIRDNALKQHEKDEAEPSSKSKGKQPVPIATKMESSASSASSAAPTTNTMGDAMATSTG
ncbi:hypothetical protein E2P81_ATG09701 [Venturia nashicola]|uniref:Autophagy-related protein 29 n=1 Tax=Venturia nashicola TaxID=86259 RepID=A0A4Z1P0P8_9PEZI|nr:hypothetical protein E6O75_ATG09913 [Venturia nashicola]TLD26044.1 hypothetical protein E2P81_ATG09701 [Venturia nashicola]